MTATVLFMGTFLASLWIHEPSRYYFFGDSWDLLHATLTSWKHLFTPHSEHLMPLFKVFYFLQYQLFGGNHVPYMVVVYALHAANSTLVYLLGRRLSLRQWPSAMAATIFAFSSVPYEVTGWSFEQCFLMSTLFILIAVYMFFQAPHRGKTLVWVAISSLAAFWSGPIAFALPALLSAYYLLWLTNENKRVEKTQVVTTMSAVWAPIVIYLASLRAVTTFASVLATHNTRLELHKVTSMIDFTLFGTTYGLVLPSLTFVNAQSFTSAPIIIILLVLFLVACYMRLSSRGERLGFWFLVCFLLIPHLAISLGRSQLGAGEALAPRYHYLPMIAFALLVTLCSQALGNALQQKQIRRLYNAGGIALLAYYLAFHGYVIRKINPGANRGIRTQQFLRIGRQATYPSSMQAGEAILGPELPVPEYVLAPGYFPLWKVFQVLEGNTGTVVPVGPYLQDKGASFPANLISNGGFEEPAGESPWKTYGGARFIQNRLASRTGNFGAEAVLPSSGALSQDVITSCPVSISGRILTFSVQARTNRPSALTARIIFKNYEETILETYHSLPHPGDDQWHQVLVSGLSPEETCIVGVDVTNESSSELTAMLDDALLVAHPGTVDDKGKVRFQTIEQILTPQNNN